MLALQVALGYALGRLSVRLTHDAFTAWPRSTALALALLLAGWLML